MQFIHKYFDSHWSLRYIMCQHREMWKRINFSSSTLCTNRYSSSNDAHFSQKLLVNISEVWSVTKERQTLTHMIQSRVQFLGWDIWLEAVCQITTLPSEGFNKQRGEKCRAFNACLTGVQTSLNDMRGAGSTPGRLGTYQRHTTSKWRDGKSFWPPFPTYLS